MPVWNTCTNKFFYGKIWLKLYFHELRKTYANFRHRKGSHSFDLIPVSYELFMHPSYYTCLQPLLVSTRFPLHTTKILLSLTKTDKTEHNELSKNKNMLFNLNCLNWFQLLIELIFTVKFKFSKIIFRLVCIIRA